MLTKQAAEKIAHEYYNVGQQLAMHEAGLIKEANALMEAISKLTGKLPPAPKASRLGKALKGTGIAGGLALSPAAYEGIASTTPSLGRMMPMTNVGDTQLRALQELLGGNLGGAKDYLGELGGDLSKDVSGVGSYLKNLFANEAGGFNMARDLVAGPPPETFNIARDLVAAIPGSPVAR